MASLIVAAGILATNKIRDKKESRKEKKRQSYQTRYDELAKNHKENEVAYLQRRKTQSSIDEDTLKSPTGAPRRSSSDSQRSQKVEQADDPSGWVEAALKDRDKAGSK